MRSVLHVFPLVVLTVLGLSQAAEGEGLTYIAPRDHSDQEIETAVREVASRQLAQISSNASERQIDRLWLYMAAQRYVDALSVLELLQAQPGSKSDYSSLLPIELYARAMLKSKHEHAFSAQFQEVFRDKFRSFSDAMAMDAAPWFVHAPVAQLQQRLDAILSRHSGSQTISTIEIVELCWAYVLLNSY